MKIVMIRTFVAVAALLAALAVQGQVPQFTSQSYDGWLYNSPVTEVNTSTILANEIVLYTTSVGHTFMLTSPQFDCWPGETIGMKITWITDQWNKSTFVMSKVALTAALIDDGGVSVDSVTWVPTSVSRTNTVNLEITVPRGLRSARLRFASWDADVYSCGAVRQILATAVLKGDVNQDGEVSVADANAVIDVILSGVTSGDVMPDVNGDGEVSVADANAVIDVILQ